MLEDIRGVDGHGKILQRHQTADGEDVHFRFPGHERFRPFADGRGGCDVFQQENLVLELGEFLFQNIHAGLRNGNDGVHFRKMGLVKGFGEMVGAIVAVDKHDFSSGADLLVDKRHHVLGHVSDGGIILPRQGGHLGGIIMLPAVRPLFPEIFRMETGNEIRRQLIRGQPPRLGQRTV